MSNNTHFLRLDIIQPLLDVLLPLLDGILPLLDAVQLALLSSANLSTSLVEAPIISLGVKYMRPKSSHMFQQRLMSLPTDLRVPVLLQPKGERNCDPCVCGSNLRWAARRAKRG